jgi:hypothetical protein
MSLNKFSLQGRVFQTKPSLAEIEENRNRALAVARRNRDYKIARELKQSGMLPNVPGNQFGGWTGTDHVVRQDLPAPRPVTNEDRWQRYLARAHAL